MSLSYKKLSDITKPRLAKVRALFYVLQQLIKRGCAYFDTASTIRRVVEAVNPEQMRASLAICRDYIVSSLKGCHIIIDGKKLRGENPTSRGCNGLYILNAMVSGYEICVAEERVDDKTNELTVLPAVIASLCIVGAVVSLDAMGTHRNIAQQIIMQDGDYLMALKDIMGEK